MGSLGFPELIVIGIVALLLFGPKRLPDAGKALGQAIRGFKGAMDGKEEGRAEALPGRAACPACAKEVEAGAAFCCHCGHGMPSRRDASA